jgi:hypothetical protein
MLFLHGTLCIKLLFSLLYGSLSYFFVDSFDINPIWFWGIFTMNWFILSSSQDSATTIVADSMIVIVCTTSIVSKVVYVNR